MRRRRLWRTVMGILAAAVASLVCAAWPGCSTFTVGTETTYITEPLDKHGYVDYATALNQRLGKGITPENNANVLIWQAIGPHPEGGTMPAEYFEWLGIESPPEEGDYFVSWDKYRKEHLKNDVAVPRDPNSDPMSRATSWPWTAKDEPELADWLKQNEKTMALVMEATRRPDYFNPLVPRRTEDWSPGLLSALVSSLQKCRELAAAFTCRAMLRVAEGKLDEAWQDLLACHRLGRLVARGGTLIEMLVGIATDVIADKADIAFLDQSKLPSRQVLACLKNLRQLPPMPAVADKIDQCERFTLLEMMMLTARQGTTFLEDMSRNNGTASKSNGFRSRLFTRSINWDPALRNANAWIDRYVACLRMTDRDARVLEIAAIIQDVKSLKRETRDIGIYAKSFFMGPESRGEMIGNIMIALMLPGFDKLQSAVERCEQSQRNLHLAFALAAYQRDHGAYPEKLDELAPKYLEKIPDDLFSGKPLIYRLEDKGYLLYSVGVNGKDEEGRGYDDEPRGDDISIRIPVPPPREKK